MHCILARILQTVWHSAIWLFCLFVQVPPTPFEELVKCNCLSRISMKNLPTHYLLEMLQSLQSPQFGDNFIILCSFSITFLLISVETFFPAIPFFYYYYYYYCTKITISHFFTHVMCFCMSWRYTTFVRAIREVMAEKVLSMFDDKC